MIRKNTMQQVIMESFMAQMKSAQSHFTVGHLLLLLQFYPAVCVLVFD